MLERVIDRCSSWRAVCGGAALALLFAVLSVASAPAAAQFRVEITGVGATQVPIAIPKFRDEERATPSVSISGIVRADLERSGVFKSVDAPGNLDHTTQPEYPGLELTEFAPILTRWLDANFAEVARFGRIRVLAPVWRQPLPVGPGRLRAPL